MEKSLYFGTKIPQPLKTFTKYVPNLSKTAFRLIVQLIVNMLEDRPTTDGALQKIQIQAGKVDHIEELFAGIYYLIRAFLWLPPGTIKLEAFRAELKELNFNEEIITDLVSVLYGPKRLNLDATLASTQPHLPRLSNLTWRLNIVISSSSVSRILEPSILIKIKLSSGIEYTFHAPLNKFHQLRHAVALLLADMSTLEDRSFFKSQ